MNNQLIMIMITFVMQIFMPHTRFTDNLSIINLHNLRIKRLIRMKGNNPSKDKGIATIQPPINANFFFITMAFGFMK